MSTDTREELPPLPKKRRAMFCTKCGFSGPTEAEASPRGAPCQKCNYIAFVEEVDYSDDEMQAYARAALATQPAQPSAQGEACPNCRGEGTFRAMTQEHGPDDYEFDVVCPTCGGTGVPPEHRYTFWTGDGEAAMQPDPNGNWLWVGDPTKAPKGL